MIYMLEVENVGPSPPQGERSHTLWPSAMTTCARAAASHKEWTLPHPYLPPPPAPAPLLDPLPLPLIPGDPLPPMPDVPLPPKPDVPIPPIDPDELEPSRLGVLPDPCRLPMPIFPMPGSPPWGFFPVFMLLLPVLPLAMPLAFPLPKLPLLVPPPVLPPLPLLCAISNGGELIVSWGNSMACAWPAPPIRPIAMVPIEMNSFRCMVVLLYSIVVLDGMSPMPMPET